MVKEELSHFRLANQQVSQHRFTRPKEVVAWMGAMQAQDYGMVRWAVGLRLPEPDIRSVQRAIDTGDVIRTHLLRPTWHLVSARDARWIVDLTAPHIKASVKSRLKGLELTPAVLNKTIKVLETALRTGDHLTRDELIRALEKNKISARDQRAAHILIWAELEKIICSGPMRDKKNTYAHFDTRVKAQKPIGRDEGLHKLARRYFASHGPATLYDFINWSGLPAADARKSLTLAEKHLLSERIGSTVYWFTDGLQKTRIEDSVFLLPAFDEFTIGYKDRSACLSSVDKSSVISVNGILWPIIVFNGQAVGLWKKTLVKKEVKIQHEFFPTPHVHSKKFTSLLRNATEDVSAFFSTGPGNV